MCLKDCLLLLKIRQLCCKSVSKKREKAKPRANLEDSYTQLEDGSLESNKNKVWNSLSDPEYQNMYSQVMRDYTLVKGDDGKTRFAATGEEYGGPTSWFYQGSAKEGDAYKLGLVEAIDPIRIDIPLMGCKVNKPMGGSQDQKGLIRRLWVVC